MTALHIIFYAFAATAVISALAVVSARNAVHGVLFLVLTFFASAGLWMLLSAEFLSLILVLVYVGAVMTLFLFVVMMLSMKVVSRQEGFVRYLPFAAGIVVLMVGLIVLAVKPAYFGLAHVLPPMPEPADYNNVADLGAVLYTTYAFPFEIAAVLLLTAIVAAIALTHRRPEGRKSQKVSAQQAVQRDQRVRLIKMPSEKKQP
ncbi:MAG TPA: NADH-quinone oxidoreductase subunit J [Gammaproteobacteria bacterium]|nr:NADH-quinone oxidoreductase subunit J [Gammaproteobacteria bacterium]